MKKSVIMVSLLAFLALFAFSFAGCSDGADGLNGKDGVDGKDGANGAGFVWKGELESAPSNPEYMWAYYNKTDGCSYVWNGSKWDLLNGSAYATYDVEMLDLTKKAIYFRGVSETGEVVTYSEPANLYFKDDILYTLIDSKYIGDLGKVYKCDFTISDVNEDTTKIIITNTTRNATATFDLVHRTLSFSNYDAFFQSTDAYHDFVGSYPYLKLSASSNIAGQGIDLSWTTQNIHAGLYNDNGTYILALPNQFMMDIFDCAYYIFYNGEYGYTDKALGQSQKLLDDYYDTCPTPGIRSQTLADFTYNELCLNLDFNYGLKAIHGIESFPDFDTYFIAQGIKDELKSTNTKTFTENLVDVVDFYFGDGHSGFNRNSCWAGKDKIPGTKTSSSSEKYRNTLKRYGKARAASIEGASYDDTTDVSENVPVYTLSSDGKTAIVRFDAFTSSNFDEFLQADTGVAPEKLTAARDRLLANNHALLNTYVYDIREKNTAGEKLYDTIAVIAAVNKLIQDYDAEHSTAKIENIVLDLSRNGGGRFTAAAYVLSWMLGECTMDFTNPITGAKFSISYKCDADLNGICGEETDSVKDKNLFCLISPISFSCGNLTPPVLKESDKVTILGVTSGGGASSVHDTYCADGSQFQISSKYVMSTSKNGSNYDMDQGVVPDHQIPKEKNFYTTETLAKMIDSINSDTSLSGN